MDTLTPTQSLAPRPTDYLLIGEVMAELRCCKRQVYNYVHRGILPPPTHLDRKPRWRRKDVDNAKSRKGQLLHRRPRRQDVATEGP